MIQRKSYLKRSTKPIPRSPLKKRPRKPSDYARIYGSKARVEWVKSLPCAACGVVGYSVNAHTETGGIGHKASFRSIIPLCGGFIDFDIGCHEKYHQYGARSLGIDLQKAVEDVESRWLESHPKKEAK